MQTVSTLWGELYASPLHGCEWYADIAGTHVSEEVLKDVRISTALFAGSTPAVGACVAATAELTLYHPTAIPRMAEIRLYCRLTEGERASEWLSMGVYFIDTRSVSDSDTLELKCYDAMLKAEQVYLRAGDTGDWPRTMGAVVREICARLGVELDSRTRLRDYAVEYTDDYTMREVLGYIAAAHGGCFIMTPAGKLRLVTLAGSGTVHRLGQAVQSFSSAPALGAISRVDLICDERNYLTSGTDDGRTVEITCPWGTQQMADDLRKALSAVDYTPFEATMALLDPAAELGDQVEIDGVTGLLTTLDVRCDVLYAPDIAAAGDAEIDHEYPYKSPQEREIKRTLATTRSEIKKTMDSIKLSVTTTSNEGGETTAAIELKVGPSNYTGYIKLDGNVDVSGQLSADALYSALGEIADLSVNRLSTSRRVVKYLAGDTSDDNFIRVAEQGLEFVAGIAKSTTEQAKNPNGELIYWEADPAGASIGADGYPYANGERIFTTTKRSNWPVMVYQYEEQVKRAISFTSDGKYYYPVDVFGVGDNNGKQRGYLVKRQNSLELTYETSLGKLLGLAARDEGYLDLMGLRKSTALDFSEWDKGYFAELVDGEKTPYRYTVTFDQQRRPIRITDNSGHATLIRW